MEVNAISNIKKIFQSLRDIFFVELKPYDYVKNHRGSFGGYLLYQSFGIQMPASGLKRDKIIYSRLVRKGKEIKIKYGFIIRGTNLKFTVIETELQKTGIR